MSEHIEVSVGDTVSFAVGRKKTSYTAEVTGRDGAFLVTKDAEGKVRKVRPGAAHKVQPAVVAA